ncbi:MAG: GNAT family N-acetyltransferase [Candidatus Binatia bacterium]
MKNPFLVGGKTYLRPLERGDASLIVQWLNDPEVTRTLAIYRPINLHAEEEFIATIYESESEFVLGIAVQDSDRLIGVTGLHRMDFKNRHANFGIAIGDKDQWGKGYGTEVTSLMLRHAFEGLNMNRVWLHVYENNVRGIKTYEKTGFRKEGLLRQERYSEGRYWNTILMAILREEWDALQPQR